MQCAISQNSEALVQKSEFRHGAAKAARKTAPPPRQTAPPPQQAAPSPQQTAPLPLKLPLKSMLKEISYVET